ncbi:MAG: AMP nucleosidase [Hyphomicrobiaceae bacterium]
MARRAKATGPVAGAVARGLTAHEDAAEALAHISRIYDRSAARLKDRFRRFTAGEKSGDPVSDACYPYLSVAAEPADLVYDGRPSWGTLAYSGTFGTTLTRPDIFADYYLGQIERLMRYHRVPVHVGESTRPIPLPFVIDEATADLQVGDVRALQQVFALPDLASIDDAIANGTWRAPDGHPQPLALFTAERVDLALQRLHHYTGTEARHFQRFVLFTNYQRYVDAFVAHGHRSMAEGGGEEGFDAFVTPGNVELKAGTRSGRTGEVAMPGSGSSPQMPAYHLKRPDRLGVTLVNIGVGPSNAKTITDHLAVLRPHCWLMVGHCGGLRRSQQLGDYVLAHAYVREDNVLDQNLPVWVPVPPIAEVQVALQEAVGKVTGLEGDAMKMRMRTGTVVSTDDRNWELRYDVLYTRLNQSRAIAIDMESATIAANGFRFRVPYGTLLCVSDKPLHGEVKLRGMANAFYSQRISQHLTIGLEAVRILREQGIERLHSRKLRSFDEPAFR